MTMRWYPGTIPIDLKRTFKTYQETKRVAQRDHDHWKALALNIYSEHSVYHCVFLMTAGNTIALFINFTSPRYASVIFRHLNRTLTMNHLASHYVAPSWLRSALAAACIFSGIGVLGRSRGG